MSTTATTQGFNELRAWPDEPSPFSRLFEIPVYISGTYATASKPTFNVITALQGGHFAAKTVSVAACNIVHDRYDGTNRYTATAALSTSISGNTNDLVTITIKSGGTDGIGGSEVSDSTDVTGTYTFLVILELVDE